MTTPNISVKADRPDKAQFNISLPAGQPLTSTLGMNDDLQVAALNTLSCLDAFLRGRAS